MRQLICRKARCADDCRKLLGDAVVDHLIRHLAVREIHEDIALFCDFLQCFVKRKVRGRVLKRIDSRDNNRVFILPYNICDHTAHAAAGAMQYNFRHIHSIIHFPGRPAAPNRPWHSASAALKSGRTPPLPFSAPARRPRTFPLEACAEGPH